MTHKIPLTGIGIETLAIISHQGDDYALPSSEQANTTSETAQPPENQHPDSYWQPWSWQPQ